MQTTSIYRGETDFRAYVAPQTHCDPLSYSETASEAAKLPRKYCETTREATRQRQTAKCTKIRRTYITET